MRRPRAGRWVGRLLMLCGVLLLADVACTVVWQEPIGALNDARHADAARAELRALTAAPSAAAQRGLHGALRVAADAGQLRRAAEPATAVGEIEIPRLRLHHVLFNGSSSASLARGPGLYDGSPFPGEVGTVAVAGHRTTHGAPFANIDRLRRGDRITLVMPYGRLTYVVRSTRIVAPDDVGVLRAARGDRRLVLSACHPRFSAAQRFIVVATPLDSRPLAAENGRGTLRQARYTTI